MFGDRNCLAVVRTDPFRLFQGISLSDLAVKGVAFDGPVAGCLLKDTSLVSVIALRDVTKQAQNIVSNTYQAYVPYVSLAIIYLVLVIILTKLLGIFERRLRESDRR